MEQAQSLSVERPGCWSCLASSIVDFFSKLKKIGMDDPRRITHSFKVALGLTFVSTFYYVNPIFKDLGNSVMWAVLTVILVMEFTVGAAILKGLNRTCATFLAGALGLGAHHFAILFGVKGEPIVLGVVVFLVASMLTFARFIPELKARYDYGVMIFILTFCLVTVSSYRKDNIVEMAKDRVLTIAIGVAISFITSILVFPAWAGEDLHVLTTTNLEKLAKSLESFGEINGSHKSILNSKSNEDTLANLASWEPPHGRFGFHHPWEQYRKIGEQSRQCAYLIETLNTYTKLNRVELKGEVKEGCEELSSNCSKVLSAAASTMSTADFVAAKCYIETFRTTTKQMKSAISEGCVSGKEVMNVGCVVSLTMEVNQCVEEIVASVEKLGRLAKFRSSEVVLKDLGIRTTVEGEAADISIVTEEAADISIVTEE